MSDGLAENTLNVQDELPPPKDVSSGAANSDPGHNHKKTNAECNTAGVSRDPRWPAGWWVVPLAIAGAGLWALIAWLLS